MGGVSSWGSQWRDMAEDSKEPFFWPPSPSSMRMLLLHDLLHSQYCKIILQCGRSFLQDTRGFTDILKARNMVGITHKWILDVKQRITNLQSSVPEKLGK